MVTPGSRRRPRRDERGAAVFIVVMVITLLTAIGIFAARSASMVDMAAGYDRQASQTRYLSEYGTLAAIAQLGSGSAQAYVDQMDRGTDECRANLGLPVDPPQPCYKIFKSELEMVTSAVSNESLLEASSPDLTESGSFGHHAKVLGDFVVELTDKGPTGAPVAGTDVGGTGTRFGYVKVALTATAQIRPQDGDATCSEGSAAVAGQQSMRAHAIVGPVQRNP